MVHPNNRLETCQQCHIGATAGFATFQPHATTNDLKRYPYTWLASKFMLALLGGTFAFFWTHSALWYYREYKDRQQRKARPHVRTDELNLQQGPCSALERNVAHCPPRLRNCDHHVGTDRDDPVLCRQLLGTGPCRERLAGVLVTGVVHRVFSRCLRLGICRAPGLCGHSHRPELEDVQLVRAVLAILNLQDLQDAIAMCSVFRFVGRQAGVRPLHLLGKVSDYWAPFWGVTIIGVSGFMLWFTNLTAKYFPGCAVFNIATIFHGEEAFLAAGFLFTVHFFNNHWRVRQFPARHPDVHRLGAAGEVQA